MKALETLRPEHRHLLIAGLACVLVAALLLWSFAVLSEARQQQQTISEKTRKSAQEQQQKHSEQAEIARLLPIYQQLQKLEQPADAPTRAKRLLNLQKEMQLPGLRYEFQPPQTLAGPADVQRHFISQTLRLHLDLLHEEDLLRFLEQLSDSAPALLIIRQCQLARRVEETLTADCQIDWFSLDKAT